MSAWLVKSEPSVYSIDDLKRDRKTSWDGVRNYQARNYLRAMSKGETVLIYHSSCDEPAVVGVGRVGSAAAPDNTQFDQSSEYFDAKATREKPIWFSPEITFQRQIGPVPLTALRTARGLKDLALLKRGNRLSVMPVSDAELNVILKMAGSH